MNMFLFVSWIIFEIIGYVFFIVVLRMLMNFTQRKTSIILFNIALPYIVIRTSFLGIALIVLAALIF